MEIILTPEEAKQGGDIFVPVSYEILCEHCQGGGHFAEFICDQCQGWGKFGKNEEVRLRMPAGVRNRLVERIILWSSGYQEISLTLTFRINRY
jgi:DnaJ-class molecular chaperone